MIDESTRRPPQLRAQGRFSFAGRRAPFRGRLRAMPFIATMAYELHPQTEPDAAKLLRAELVGRRWQDRQNGEKMPANCLWMARSAEPHHTTDDLHAACAEDLYRAVAAVSGMGKKIALLRAWVQVTGSGTHGLIPGARPAPR
jgi:hypothetical protein